ncbi:MAG TPA: hypothetical protein VLN59_17705, partial [Burkholderiales bacterium]|nr:hypothetical protein [Burkholderiales bacterium]
MKEKERRVPTASVFFIELVDAAARELQQRFVLGKAFVSRVPKIGKQTEMQVFVAIREKANLEC